MANGARPRRASGDPATAARDQLTVKQQREARRQQKIADLQRERTRRKRLRILGWSAGSVVAIAAIAAVIAVIVTAPAPSATYEAGGSTGADFEGLERFTNVTTHVEGPVDYPQSPPAGGPHSPIWQNCGIYDEPVTPENAVHSMEHGAVWVTYDPSRVDDAELDALGAHLPSSYVVVSPLEGLDAPIVLSAWNAQLRVDSATDERIPEFFTEFWRSQLAPEPNATCAGGVGTPA